MEVQDRVYKAITSKQSQGIINAMFKFGAVFPECKPLGDPKVYADVLFNSGVKSNPEMLNNFKRVIWTSPDVKRPEFIKNVEMQAEEIKNINEPWKDRLLGPLWAKGYRWDIKGGAQGARPNWLAKDQYELGLGEDKYTVRHDLLNNKFFLIARTGKKGGTLEPADFGNIGAAMLGGGVPHSGGNKGGHVRGIKAGPKTQERIEKILFNGGFGENRKVSHMTDLRCIQQAIRTAIYKYGGLASRDAKKLSFPDSEMYTWAVEGLHNFMGDRAFQVGYITPEEIEHILKWNQQKELDMFEKGRWVKVEPGQGDFTLDKSGKIVPMEGGDYSEDPDWEGWGIQSILHRNGVTDAEGNPDAEIWQMIIDTVKDAFKSDPVFNYDKLPSQLQGQEREWAIKMQKVLGENAYRARVREISKFIVNRMSEATAKADAEAKKVRTFSALGSTDAEGNQKSFDGNTKTVHGDEDFYDDPEEYGVADEKELRKTWGLEEPENGEEITPERPTATFDGELPRPKLQVVSDDPHVAELQRRKQAKLASQQTPAFAAKQTPAPAKKVKAPTLVPAAVPQDPHVAELLRIKQARLAAQQTPTLAARDVPAPAQDPHVAELLRMKQARLAAKNKMETSVVFDPKVKPHDGGGFNYWGEPGKTAVSITGEPDTAKSDPIGKKGMKRYARKHQCK
jgi:hypothetical protein